MNTDAALNARRGRLSSEVSLAAMLAAIFCGSNDGILTEASTSPVAVSITTMQPRGRYSVASPSQARCRSASSVSRTPFPVPGVSTATSGLVSVSRRPCAVIKQVTIRASPEAVNRSS